MRIVVETERCGDYHGPPVIQVRVKVGGQEGLSLSCALLESEMASRFDILWEQMGEMIKKTSAEKNRREVLVRN